MLLLLALAATLAACGSSSNSSSPPGASKPAVTIGDKNFAEENILGELYAQALQAKGFTVTLMENVGSTEIIYKALTGGQIQCTPSTRACCCRPSPTDQDPGERPGGVRRSEGVRAKDGLTMLNYTPFYDSDAIATLPATRARTHLASIADLKTLGKC